ncbi:MAG: STAS domain-containing protein [Streptosporangiaceae bacterium]
MELLSLSSHRIDLFTIIGLTGELQHETVGEAETYILNTLTTGTRHLVLNLTGVTFLDSSGVNVLAKTNWAVRSMHGSLKLVTPEGTRPHRVLTLTGILQFLPVFETLELAFAEQ